MTDTARATGRPWALVRHFASAQVVKEIGPKSHRKIATVSAFGGLNDIDIANATLIISAVNEYDALKAVEAAAREDPFATIAVVAALAALDAIGKPPSGKTGEAVV